MATKCIDYNFHEIEPHWQSFWEQNGSFRANNNSSKNIDTQTSGTFPQPLVSLTPKTCACSKSVADWALTALNSPKNWLLAMA